MADWLLEEDELLKTKLGGMTVADQRSSARPVKVWFRFPEPELRDVDYPFLTLDLIDISEALDRAQRGARMQPTIDGYRPPDLDTVAPDGRIFITDWPVAMNIDYQVTSWARNQQHDRAITQQMWRLFPGRYGSIGGQADPYVRPISCQLTGYTPGDRLDDFGKRLFRKMYTVRVFSELWVSQVRDVAAITSIDFTVLSLQGDEPGWFNSVTCHE